MAFASSLREGIEVPWVRGREQPASGPEGPGKRGAAILTHEPWDRNFTTRYSALTGRAAAPLLRAGRVLALVMTLLPVPAAASEPLVLLVQPPSWSGDGARFDVRPLAALVERALQRPVRTRQPGDVLSHWQLVRTPDGYHMALDEAHFSAYRARRHGFTVLARAADDVRFAIVVRPGTVLTAPGDLAARPVAAPAPPSLAAVRLMELFPEPARGPKLVVLGSRDLALDALSLGRVDAVVMDAGDVGAGGVAALETNASPGRGFSVAGSLEPSARAALLRALSAARHTGAVRRALAGVGIRELEPASNEAFEDSETLLRGTWGYR